MTYVDYDLLPERGKPRSKVVYGDQHRYVLRALRWHRIKGMAATDQSIFDVIIRAQGKVISQSGARTRRAELVTMGLVERGRVTGHTEAGRTCKTWRLTAAGGAKADAEFEAARQLQLDVERVA